MRNLLKLLPKSLKRSLKIALFGRVHGGLKPFFEHLDAIEPFVSEGQTVIEVGSNRDAGSSNHLIRWCDQHQLNFITIDPNAATSKAVQSILDAHAPDRMKAVNLPGEVFLKDYHGNDIIFAYLDGFDVVIPGVPHKQSTIDAYARNGIDLLTDGNRISAELHLETAKYVAANLLLHGIIGFDDTWEVNGEWFGKGATSVPYLLERGYRQLNAETVGPIHRSVMLQRVD